MQARRHVQAAYQCPVVAGLRVLHPFPGEAETHCVWRWSDADRAAALRVAGTADAHPGRQDPWDAGVGKSAVHERRLGAERLGLRLVDLAAQGAVVVAPDTPVWGRFAA